MGGVDLNPVAKQQCSIYDALSSFFDMLFSWVSIFGLRFQTR